MSNVPSLPACDRLAIYINTLRPLLGHICLLVYAQGNPIELFQLQRNRSERTKTGGGVRDPDCDLTEIEEMFLDYVGVEGVVGKLIKVNHEHIGLHLYTASLLHGNITICG